MKPKFTPGPWHLTTYFIDYKTDKTPYFGVDSVNAKPGRPLAGPLHKENAALIAAAPEMFEALNEFLECGPNAGHNQELINQVKAALAKAQGES